MSEVLGIDVSHHNGKIDWSKVAKAGYKFTVMKAQYEAQSHRNVYYLSRLLYNNRDVHIITKEIKLWIFQKRK